MKKCFNCKRKLPLFLFLKDDSIYKVKSEMGKCKVCRLCNIKRSFKNNGVFGRFDGKFQTKEMSKIKILIFFLIRK
jgi:hypothetical protein